MSRNGREAVYCSSFNGPLRCKIGSSNSKSKRWRIWRYTWSSSGNLQNIRLINKLKFLSFRLNGFIWPFSKFQSNRKNYGHFLKNLRKSKKKLENIIITLKIWEIELNILRIMRGMAKMKWSNWETNTEHQKIT